jgi:CRISPR/Cas system-associated endonuclease Cas1
MIYGDYGKLETKILEAIVSKGVPIIIHRRNVARPIYICTPLRPDQADTLSAQMLCRANERKKLHVARKLLQAKFRAMQWLLPEMPELKRSASLEKMRQVEALHAKRYWTLFYRGLGIASQGRRKAGKVAAALDCMSKFVSGIILRWTTYHHLSPFHGFLHAATDYPALVYDLIEPYRGYFDRVVFEKACLVESPDENSGLIGMTIEGVKEALDEQVYTGLTRQIVTRHELLHGAVLGLKCYLEGRHSRFLIPQIDQPKGGRPRKVDFRLYGRQAGRTDFWRVATSAADEEERRVKAVLDLIRDG